MSLSLRYVFEETQQQYELELICGEQGLDRIINWVYVSENIATASFLYGGELVITTGMSKDSSSTWLHDFISKLIEQGTCGLILNTGLYLFPEDITPEIRTLCEKHAYPLITMPWKIHINDITRSLYNYIFIDTQTSNVITEAFLDILHNYDMEHGISVLHRNHYPKESPYSICCIRADHSPAQLTEKQMERRIQFTLQQYLKQIQLPGHICKTESYFLIITPISDLSSFSAQMQALTARLEQLFPILTIYAGVGNQCESLTSLSQCFFYAKSTASMAYYYKKNFCTFQELGFFKLLLSVSDQSILTSYYEEKLGSILNYDKEHGSSYLATLYQYLIYDGSIQKVADALFCHRNTINYRVRILREILCIPLDNVQERFELMAAFHIGTYLESIRHS